MAQLTRDQLRDYLFSRGYWSRGRYVGTTSLDLGDNTGYLVTQTEPPGLRESQIADVANPAGFNSPYMVPEDYNPDIAGMQFVPNWRGAVKDADNGGGWVEVVANIGLSAAVSAAAWNLAGSLSTDGFSLGAEATEEITVSMTETQGASTVGETGLEWYSVDPGPDPFATTADVNAGWSFDGGYSGVDWYNSAGVGEINAGESSLWDIFGKATTAVKQGLGAVVAASGALQATRNNLAQPVPNYTRAAGGINVGLLAVGLLAWKLL